MKHKKNVKNVLVMLSAGQYRSTKKSYESFETVILFEPLSSREGGSTATNKIVRRS